MLKILFEPPIGTQQGNSEKVFNKLFAGSQTQSRHGTRYIAESQIMMIAAPVKSNSFVPSRKSETLLLITNNPDIAHTIDYKNITIQEREILYNSRSYDVNRRKCDCCGTATSDCNVDWYDVEDRSIADFFACCHVCVKKWMPN